MDLTDTEPLPEMSEQSGEYRLRFRYQLWSQVAQDFRSRAPAPRRFVSTSSNGAAVDLHPGIAEQRDAPDADTGSAAGLDR
jgi:hypothetical protein